jgi:hypothetical protein
MKINDLWCSKTSHTKISAARVDKQFVKGALIYCSAEINFENRQRASARLAKRSTILSRVLRFFDQLCPIAE